MQDYALTTALAQSGPPGAASCNAASQRAFGMGGRRPSPGPAACGVAGRRAFASGYAPAAPYFSPAPTAMPAAPAAMPAAPAHNHPLALGAVMPQTGAQSCPPCNVPSHAGGGGTDSTFQGIQVLSLYAASSVLHITADEQPMTVGGVTTQMVPGKGMSEPFGMALPGAKSVTVQGVEMVLSGSPSPIKLAPSMAYPTATDAAPQVFVLYLSPAGTYNYPLVLVAPGSFFAAHVPARGANPNEVSIQLINAMVTYSKTKGLVTF